MTDTRRQRDQVRDWNLVIKIYTSNRNRLGGRSSPKMSCSSQLLWRSKLLLSVGPEGQETVRNRVNGIGPVGKSMLADRTDGKKDLLIAPDQNRTPIATRSVRPPATAAEGNGSGNVLIPVLETFVTVLPVALPNVDPSLNVVA